MTTTVEVVDPELATGALLSDAVWTETMTRWSRAQIELAKATVAKGATDDTPFSDAHAVPGHRRPR